MPRTAPTPSARLNGLAESDWYLRAVGESPFAASTTASSSSSSVTSSYFSCSNLMTLLLVDSAASRAMFADGIWSMFCGRGYIGSDLSMTNIGSATTAPSPLSSSSGASSPSSSNSNFSAAVTVSAAIQGTMVLGSLLRVWSLSLERPTQRLLLANLREKMRRQQAKAERSRARSSAKRKRKGDVEEEDEEGQGGGDELTGANAFSPLPVRSTFWRGCLLWCSYYCGADAARALVAKTSSSSSVSGNGGSTAAEKEQRRREKKLAKKNKSKESGSAAAADENGANARSLPQQKREVEGDTVVSPPTQQKSSSSSTASSILFTIVTLPLRPFAVLTYISLAELQWQPSFADVLRRNALVALGSLMCDCLQLPLAAVMGSVGTTGEVERLIANTAPMPVTPLPPAAGSTLPPSSSEAIHTIIGTAPFAVFVAVRTVGLLMGYHSPWLVVMRRGLLQTASASDRRGPYSSSPPTRVRSSPSSPAASSPSPSSSSSPFVIAPSIIRIVSFATAAVAHPIGHLGLLHFMGAMGLVGGGGGGGGKEEEGAVNSFRFAASPASFARSAILLSFAASLRLFIIPFVDHHAKVGILNSLIFVESVLMHRYEDAVRRLKWGGVVLGGAEYSTLNATNLSTRGGHNNRSGAATLMQSSAATSVVDGGGGGGGGRSGALPTSGAVSRQQSGLFSNAGNNSTAANGSRYNRTASNVSGRLNTTAANNVNNTYISQRSAAAFASPTSSATSLVEKVVLRRQRMATERDHVAERIARLTHRLDHCEHLSEEVFGVSADQLLTLEVGQLAEHFGGGGASSLSAGGGGGGDVNQNNHNGGGGFVTPRARSPMSTAAGASTAAALRASPAGGLLVPLPPSPLTGVAARPSAAVAVDDAHRRTSVVALGASPVLSDRPMSVAARPPGATTAYTSVVYAGVGAGAVPQSTAAFPLTPSRQRSLGYTGHDDQHSEHYPTDDDRAERMRGRRSSPSSAAGLNTTTAPMMMVGYDGRLHGDAEEEAARIAAAAAGQMNTIAGDWSTLSGGGGRRGSAGDASMYYIDDVSQIVASSDIGGFGGGAMGDGGDVSTMTAGGRRALVASLDADNGTNTMCAVDANQQQLQQPPTSRHHHQVREDRDQQQRIRAMMPPPPPPSRPAGHNGTAATPLLASNGGPLRSNSNSSRSRRSPSANAFGSGAVGALNPHQYLQHTAPRPSSRPRHSRSNSQTLLHQQQQQQRGGSSSAARRPSSSLFEVVPTAVDGDDGVAHYRQSRTTPRDHFSPVGGSGARRMSGAMPSASAAAVSSPPTNALPPSSSSTRRVVTVVDQDGTFHAPRRDATAAAMASSSGGGGGGQQQRQGVGATAGPGRSHQRSTAANRQRSSSSSATAAASSRSGKISLRAIGRAIARCAGFFLATPPFGHPSDPSVFEAVLVTFLCTHNAYRDSFAAMVETPLVLGRVRFAATSYLRAGAGEAGLFSEEATAKGSSRHHVPQSSGGGSRRHHQQRSVVAMNTTSSRAAFTPSLVAYPPAYGLPYALLFENEAAVGLRILTRRGLPTVPLYGNGGGRRIRLVRRDRDGIAAAAAAASAPSSIPSPSVSSAVTPQASLSSPTTASQNEPSMSLSRWFGASEAATSVTATAATATSGASNSGVGFVIPSGRPASVVQHQQQGNRQQNLVAPQQPFTMTAANISYVSRHPRRFMALSGEDDAKAMLLLRSARDAPLSPEEVAQEEAEGGGGGALFYGGGGGDDAELIGFKLNIEMAKTMLMEHSNQQQQHQQRQRHDVDRRRRASHSLNAGEEGGDGDEDFAAGGAATVTISPMTTARTFDITPQTTARTHRTMAADDDPNEDIDDDDVDGDDEEGANGAADNTTPPDDLGATNSPRLLECVVTPRATGAAHAHVAADGGMMTDERLVGTVAAKRRSSVVINDGNTDGSDAAATAVALDMAEDDDGAAPSASSAPLTARSQRRATIAELAVADDDDDATNGNAKAKGKQQPRRAKLSTRTAHLAVHSSSSSSDNDAADDANNNNHDGDGLTDRSSPRLARTVVARSSPSAMGLVGDDNANANDDTNDQFAVEFMGDDLIRKSKGHHRSSSALDDTAQPHSNGLAIGEQNENEEGSGDGADDDDNVEATALLIFQQQRVELSRMIFKLRELLDDLHRDDANLSARVGFYTAVAAGLSRRLVVRSVWFQGLAVALSGVLVRFPLETLAMLIETRAFYHIFLAPPSSSSLSAVDSMKAAEIGSGGDDDDSTQSGSNPFAWLLSFIGNEFDVVRAVLRGWGEGRLQSAAMVVPSSSSAPSSASASSMPFTSAAPSAESTPAALHHSPILPSFLRGSMLAGAFLDAHAKYVLLSPLYCGVLPHMLLVASSRLMATWEDTRF